LRIVETGLWERVQARLGAIRESAPVAKARAQRFWERRRAKHLLTGKTACGSCGASFAAIGRDYLACGRAHRQGTCTNTRGIRRAVLEDLILEALKQRLMARELVNAFIDGFHEEVNRQVRGREAARTATATELSAVGRKLNGLIEALAEGFRAPGLQARLDALERRKAELAQRLAAPAPPAVRLHPNLAALYRQKVADLRAALAAPETRAEALEIVRGLVERVMVTPAADGFEIELTGAIAAMIALAQGGTGGDPALFACSVKVVAGAGNHRHLTLPAVAI
jgi:hypothetical protein